MKTCFLTVIGIATLFAYTSQARQIEASIDCNCAEWSYSPDGEMKLTTSSQGVGSSSKVTDETQLKLLSPLAQSAKNKLGYHSFTPENFFRFFKSEKENIDAIKAITFIQAECQKMANQYGLLSCGVSVTVPINDKAFEINKK